jgi:hypothetical protein
MLLWGGGKMSVRNGRGREGKAHRVLVIELDEGSDALDWEAALDVCCQRDHVGLAIQVEVILRHLDIGGGERVPKHIVETLA